VHNGPVLGSGISGLVRLVTHKATGLKYAVKVLDLGLVDNEEGLKQLREEIFIMCQLGKGIELLHFCSGASIVQPYLTHSVVSFRPPQHSATRGSV
jgi:serine/threonine protein kinase